MKRHLLSIAFILVVTAVSGSQVLGQKRATKPKPKPRHPAPTTIIGTTDVYASPVVVASSPETQRRVDTFLKAWSTLNDNYFDKTFNGLDWNKVRQDFLPRVSAAKSDSEVHRLIEEMVAKLEKSHFGLIPPEYFASLRAAQKKAKEREKIVEGSEEKTPVQADTPSTDDEDTAIEGRYGIGVELRLIDNKFVIVDVEKQSGATIAGLKPGYIIEKINGVTLDDLTSRLMLAYPNVRHLQRYLPIQIVSFFLNGEHDTSVVLTCLDENDQAREFTVPRLTLGGETITLGQRFPAQFLQFRTASLNDDVGYIKFNVFGMPVIGKFCDALTEFSTKKAIIVDLRGNIGGLLGTIIGLSGMLTDKPFTIGTSLYRYRSEPVAVKPKAKNFKGKLVFLVDGQSMSAAELFAAGLQENDRILVVGERTAGEALPAGSVELPTGAVLVYPVANFRTGKGKFIEGTGVVPNFTVSLDRRSLLRGEDAQLEKALALIKEDKAFPKAEPPVRVVVTDPVGAPPPPKAAGSGIGTGPAPKAKAKDPKAVQILANFAAAIGGPDAAKQLSTYEAAGRAKLSNAGSDTLVNYQVFREKADKYAVILTSPVIGEVREVHSGKDVFVQSDYGVESDSFGFDTARTHLFSALTNASDLSSFTSLKYVGAFEDEHGRKLQLVEGTMAPGLPVTMSFDSRTNLLVRCLISIFSYTLGDYRKVDTLTLPFSIDVEGMIDVKLDSIKLGAPIDPANFQKKEKCFDKPL